MRAAPWGFVLAGGLILAALPGCTPKPNQQQLQELDRTCAAADDAERALTNAQRQVSPAESQLAQRRQMEQDRANYLRQVRQNVPTVEQAQQEQRQQEELRRQQLQQQQQQQPPRRGRTRRSR